jgi:hypothetical protein
VVRLLLWLQQVEIAGLDLPQSDQAENNTVENSETEPGAS